MREHLPELADEGAGLGGKSEHQQHCEDDGLLHMKNVFNNYNLWA